MEQNLQTDPMSSSDAGAIQRQADDIFDRTTEIRQLRPIDRQDSGVDDSHQQAASTATEIRKKTGARQPQVSLKRLQDTNLPGNLDLVGISSDRVRQKSVQTLRTDQMTSIRELESDLAHYKRQGS